VGLALQNAFWTVYRERARRSRGLRAAAARAEERRFVRYVRPALARYAAAWAVSDADRREVAALAPELPIALVPNGVDAAAFTGLPLAGGEPGRLLFAGTLSYGPNAEAVRWLVGEVLPRVRARRPEAHLRIVGRGASGALERLAGEAVGFAGWVPDVAAEYAAASVALAPIRSGSGTNLKVIEALAAGRPLAATPMAIRGLSVAPDVDLLVGESPEAFAAAVVRLLEDRELAARLAAAGRARVAAAYDWDALAGTMHEGIERWLRR
jgi:glycosyltransferase involved in cell wall biosynthesis